MNLETVPRKTISEIIHHPKLNTILPVTMSFGAVETERIKETDGRTRQLKHGIPFRYAFQNPLERPRTL
jgi:hypothetical protein